MSNEKWAKYHMERAEHAATKSKDTTKVGAALVGPEDESLLSAYNGPPRGVLDKPERFERPAKYLFASHAEANLIAFAARAGIRTKGCTVFVTHHPCAHCAKALIQAGISCVVYGPGTTSMPAEEFEAAAIMFDEARVALQPLHQTHHMVQPGETIARLSFKYNIHWSEIWAKNIELIGPNIYPSPDAIFIGERLRIR